MADQHKRERGVVCENPACGMIFRNRGRYNSHLPRSPYGCNTEAYKGLPLDIYQRHLLKKSFPRVQAARTARPQEQATLPQNTQLEARQPPSGPSQPNFQPPVAQSSASSYNTPFGEGGIPPFTDNEALRLGDGLEHDEQYSLLDRDDTEMGYRHGQFDNANHYIAESTHFSGSLTGDLATNAAFNAGWDMDNLHDPNVYAASDTRWEDGDWMTSNRNEWGGSEWAGGEQATDQNWATWANGGVTDRAYNTGAHYNGNNMATGEMNFERMEVDDVSYMTESE
ncbi:hypothetical protein BDV93DRAFT_561389 [Ceratobasidium sp. AG-I]|nr:hypothetical protein BDV93DRAFT_561389 [Ceratobasidium sp. AG-I]